MLTEKGSEILGQVREIIMEHPSRHEQQFWFGNVFDQTPRMPIDRLRRYAGLDVPETPEDPDNPLCGTTACVAGWIDILAAPEDSMLRHDWVDLPDGESVYAPEYARQETGLDYEQTTYLFSSNRTRDEVLAALDYLVNVNPDADGYELARECGDEAREFGHDEEVPF